MSGGLLDREELAAFGEDCRAAGLRVVFTNGCFDLLHAGHVRYLNEARSLGDVLVVGLNTDDSVRRLKGEGRPLTPERERAEILLALAAVDAVVLFAEETPLEVIRALSPAVLVKGGDWDVEAIVGREHVRCRGGEVRSIPLLEGRSTTAILRKLRGRP